MPICKESQKCVQIGWNESYFDEHMMGEDKYTRCGHYVRSQPFPKDGQINLHPQKKEYPKQKQKRTSW